jgi:regulator of sirC expression with transglutaminase-like and TPR domain
MIGTDPHLTEDRLRALCAGDGTRLDIATAALWLAALRRPGVDLEPYRQHLASMADAVADLVRRRGTALDVLRQVLAASYGYRGDTDTYDDLQNADLLRVIDRRKGLPVALSIVYMHVARAQGWECVGLAFPGHFLIRVEIDGSRVVLDPFYGGIAREASDMRRLLKSVGGGDAELSPHHFDAVTDRDVLLRLENNTKSRLLQRQDDAGATAALGRMLLVAPDRPELLFELGMLEERLGHARAAIAALDRFIAVAGTAGAYQDARYQAARTLQELRRKLN